jgi:hypothetical protein
MIRRVVEAVVLCDAGYNGITGAWRVIKAGVVVVVQLVAMAGT